MTDFIIERAYEALSIRAAEIVEKSTVSAVIAWRRDRLLHVPFDLPAHQGAVSDAFRGGDVAASHAMEILASVGFNPPVSASPGYILQQAILLEYAALRLGTDGYWEGRPLPARLRETVAGEVIAELDAMKK